MEPSWTWLLVAVLSAALVLALAGWRLASTGASRRSRALNARAAAGEARAERILARAGYRVLDRQVTARWTLLVDGRAVGVSSRADLLVARGGRRYVAEVKTGDLAPDPSLPATRRQLLEYLHAFDAHGVLLVDVREGTVVRVGFDW